MVLDARDDGDGGVLIAVKAVPGAKRDSVVGLLGDRLKVRVSAPPEGGKANKAICALLARELGMKKGAVEIVGGAGQAEKTVRIRGLAVESLRSRLDALGISPDG